MFSVQYIPLSVRVRAWNLSIFSDEDMESFLQEDASVIMSKVAAREKVYPIQTSSYVDFEHSVEYSILEYLKVASKTSVGSSRIFIRELFQRFEITNLKNVVRMCISGKFQDVFYPHEFTPSLTVKKLADIRTINELITLLDDTPYRAFRTVLEQAEREKSALYWELALDNYFVSRITQAAKLLDMDSKKSIKQLLLFPIQKDRIVSLYRYRFHYQIEPSEAIKFVPNLTSFMSLEEWKKLAYSVSPTEFHAQLVEHRYIHADIPNYASALNIEFQKQLEKTCIKFIRKDLTSIASFLAFFQLKQIQLKKIVTIIEAKELNVSPDEVMQFLFL